MFTLLFTSVDASSHGREFPTLSQAIAHGRKTGFEFTVWHEGALEASWSVFGGLELERRTTRGTMTLADGREFFGARSELVCDLGRCVGSIFEKGGLWYGRALDVYGRTVEVNPRRKASDAALAVMRVRERLEQ